MSKETVFRLFGAELSPYSVKVRSYLRYKKIDHEWIVRDMSTMEEFSKYAKLPLIPLLVTPDGQGMQDSTPVLEKLEEKFPDPSIHPDEPVAAFISALIEEYGDEWGNKHMFHYRWTREVDQLSAADRLARMNMPEGDDAQIKGAAAMIRERMVPRLSFVGSSPETADQIENSFKTMLGLVEAHLGDRDYLFGGRPAFADFGLFAQLYEELSDPTTGGIINSTAPRVARWIERMLDPKATGDFEPWPALAPTLMPLLKKEVGDLFLPWTAANAAALAAGEPRFSVELQGKTFSQDTQKYHARSLGALKARYQAVADKSALDPILSDAGCLTVLAS